ncbi:MAG: flagellar motor switch protein FliG [Vampirovibrionales bacterium]
MMMARGRIDDIRTADDLSNVQKVACLMITLGAGMASELLKNMPEEQDVERVALEIASMEKLSPQILTEVLTEFYVLFEAQGYLVAGGVSYAKEVLTDSFGEDRASKILNRLVASLQSQPFDFFNKADPLQMASSFQNENPQLVALVLAYLKPMRAAAILSALPAEIQVDVAQRIAEMDRTNPEILREVENIMETKFSSVVTGDFSLAGGVESLADILNYADRTAEKAIMDSMEIRAPEMAEQVRELMFVFDDIYKLDNVAIQRVLREVENKDLALALKGSKDEVKECIYRNMSERAASMLKDDMEFMGPVRAKEVQEKQTYIVGIIRALESQGVIQLSYNSEDSNDFIV